MSVPPPHNEPHHDTALPGESAGPSDIPEVLAAQLRAMHEPPAADPDRIAGLDATVHAAARQRAAAIQRRRFVLRGAIWGSVAAAAALAVLATVWRPWHHRGPGLHGAIPQAFAEKDINKDGVVDILDALFLARRLERSQERPPVSWDLTGDGNIDQLDVDALAAAAVALGEKEQG